MGEFILREEGYEVVSVTDGQAAVVRLDEIAPDLILADAEMPYRSGYQVCEYVKTHPQHARVPVILTAGAHEAFDDAEAARVRSDASMKKPFEASTLLEVVKTLLARAPELEPEPPPPVVMPATLADEERVRAAVTIALDRATPHLIEAITQNVLIALRSK